VDFRTLRPDEASIRNFLRLFSDLVHVLPVGFSGGIEDGLTMKPEDNRPYGKWSREELRNAEVTASQFLEENSVQIADTMRAKVKFLETLLQRLSQKKVGLADRLEYFARISEIAELLQDDADGFFELASQPVVARILATIPPK
jgi:hypothetical protein